MLHKFRTSESPSRVALFYVSITLILIGYMTALIGCIAMFKIPLMVTVGMVFGGGGISILPGLINRRLALVNVSRTQAATQVIGILLIAAIMALFANSNWMVWYLHPAGFQGTWFFLVNAFFHFRSILKQFPSKNRDFESPLSDYDEDQKNNPYSPPMRAHL